MTSTARSKQNRPPFCSCQHIARNFQQPEEKSCFQICWPIAWFARLDRLCSRCCQVEMRTSSRSEVGLKTLARNIVKGVSWPEPGQRRWSQTWQVLKEREPGDEAVRWKKATRAQIKHAPDTFHMGGRLLKTCILQQEASITWCDLFRPRIFWAALLLSEIWIFPPSFLQDSFGLGKVSSNVSLVVDAGVVWTDPVWPHSPSYMNSRTQNGPIMFVFVWACLWLVCGRHGGDHTTHLQNH